MVNVSVRDTVGDDKEWSLHDVRVEQRQGVPPEGRLDLDQIVAVAREVGATTSPSSSHAVMRLVGVSMSPWPGTGSSGPPPRAGCRC